MAFLAERTQVGKREDLANLIAVADMATTPVSSRAVKDPKLCNSMFEWQADNFRAPTLTGHVDGVPVENADYVDQSAGRKELQGRVHYFLEPFAVSRLADNLSDVAGLGKKREFANSAAKAITVVKRAIEAVICSDNESTTDDGSSQGYETRGLGKWIQNGPQSDLPVDALYRTPTASIYTGAFADFDEEAFLTLLESIWNQRMAPGELTLVAGSRLKRRISSFANWDPNVTSTNAPVRTFNQDAKSKEIVNRVDVYQGDFNTVSIIASPWNAADSGDATVKAERGYLLDMEDIKLRYNQMPELHEHPYVGGVNGGHVEAILGLQVGNPLKHGKIAPVNPS